MLGRYVQEVMPIPTESVYHVSYNCRSSLCWDCMCRKLCQYLPSQYITFLIIAGVACWDGMCRKLCRYLPSQYITFLIIAGVAYVGTVCAGSYADTYRVSISRDADFNVAHTAAHELAHG